MAKDYYCDIVFKNKANIKKVKETKDLLAFHHTRPSYPLHIVIVPKKHLVSLTDLDNMDLIKKVFEMATDIIKKRKLNNSNFRIITNGGSFQDSKHLHFHLVSENSD